MAKKIIIIVSSFLVFILLVVLVCFMFDAIKTRYLEKDYEYLKDLWKEISTKAIQSSVNGVPIYQEINVVEQVIRDAYESDEKSEIIISGEKCYNDVVQFAKKIMPNEVEKIKIEAIKKDSRSTISGDIGEKKLTYGLNKFKVIVTSESGLPNTYNINVTREDGRSTDNTLKIGLLNG